MIVSLTLNPSLDATLVLTGPLSPGEVHRHRSPIRNAAGKGINVSRTVARAGRDTLAVFPARDDDLFTQLITESGLPCDRVDNEGTVRVNITILDPDGTTTKLNGAGARLDEETLDQLVETTIRAAGPGDWVVLAGSLPPGVPQRFYATLTEILHETIPGVRVAVDTSDRPLEELGRRLGTARPDLIKPNEMELHQLLDVAGIGETNAPGDTVLAARSLVAAGAGSALVTLGERGAVLATPAGAWAATPPPTTVVSTVGAGDATLAGYLLALDEGLGSEEALGRAVAYGSAATAFTGTVMPSPEDAALREAAVTMLIGS